MTAEIRLIRSTPKLNNPIANPTRTIVKFNHDKNVRSFAKNTLGSARMGIETGLFTLGPATGGSCCSDVDGGISLELDAIIHA